MASKGQSTSSGAVENLTGKADSFVPTFSGKQSEYREFRRRCDIYAAKMKMAKRQSETIFNIVTLLTGRAWDCIEDLTVTQLEESSAYEKVFQRLDSVFQYETMTELPADFEAFFVKLQRRVGQTVQEYQAEFDHVERRLVSVHKIQLPEKIRAWWFLRRSGLTKEQRQLVLTQLGETNLTLSKTMSAMNFIIGQDAKMDAPSRWSRGSATSGYKDGAYHVADGQDDWSWEDEECDENAYWEEDTFGEDTPVDQTEDYYPGAYAVEDDGTLDAPYDTEEYDNVFSSYIEAKSQLNRLRTSRGFYPVVAMVQQPFGGDRGSSKGKTKSKFKSKGKSKGGKSGAKGKRPQKGSAQARGKDAMGRSLCLRCGQAGHFARDCPNGGEKKRKAEDEEFNMVESSTDLEQPDANDEDTAVMDSGAASVLGSRSRIYEYIKCLEKKGVNVDEDVEVFRCAKGFRYGNSQREVSKHCCLLPVFVGGKKIKVLCYLIEGGAPILVGRPMLEKLDLCVSYKNGQVSYDDGATWHGAKRGPRGEFMVNLAATFDSKNLEEDYAEILMPEDFADHVKWDDKIPWQGIMKLSTAEFQPQPGEDEGACAIDDMAKDVSQSKKNSKSENGSKNTIGSLKAQDLRRMIHNAKQQTKDFNALIAEAKNPKPRERVVWEVYVGRGRVSEEVAKKKNCQSERFGFHEGWDFSRTEDRKHFVRRLVAEEPDEVLLSPECRLWSAMQEITANRSPGAKQYLIDARKENHDVHLTFVATVFQIQQRNGRHATIEHPWNSRAWKTRAWSRLRGFATYIDQCSLGLEMEDDSGVVNPVKKPTCLLTTKRYLYERMSKFVCNGQHRHTPLEGNVKGRGSRTKLAEDYPAGMAKALAECLVYDEFSEERIHAAEDGTDDLPSSAMEDLAGGNNEDDQSWPTIDDILDNPKDGEEKPKEDAVDEIVSSNRLLKKECGSRAVDYVARLHKNLGHPSPATLLRMLEEIQATDDVTKAAKGYICKHCYHRAKPSQVPPSAGISSRSFNNRLVVDSAWIQLGKERQCILTVVDEATRYTTVRILNSEKAPEFVKGLERSWIRHFGVPKYLRVDSAKGWEARAVRDWCADKGIILEVAPAEAHNWLGVVERKHQVVRRSLELYMDELGGATLSALREACIYVPPRINQMSFTRGFSPAQWVLGRTPAQELSLSHELFNPGVDSLDSQTDFARIQQKRLNAATSFLKADTDAKLRRAMTQKFYESKDRVAIGQRCWYWRIQGSGHLQKSKWRGPARCVASEFSQDGGKVVVLWLVHGTSLLRCAPQHVRPLVEDARIDVNPNPEAALKDLEELRLRSTTQFRDLAKDQEANDPMLEDLFDPAQDPRADEPMDGDEYLPTSPEITEDEGGDHGGDQSRRVPGVVSMMLPGLHSMHDERERSPRRRNSEASTEVPICPSPSDGEPVAPEVHEPPDRPEDGSPTKRLRVEQGDDRDDESPIIDDDELMIEDVHFVERSGHKQGNQLPEGWAVVDGMLELDEVWLANVVKGIRKGEINTRELTLSQREEVIAAKVKELKSFFTNQVWEFASDDDNRETDRVVTARWVLTWKKVDEGKHQAKARLVLRGFQDPDLFNLDKASPTAARLGKLTLLSLAAVQGWTISCGDVRAAFLSGASFVRKLMVRLPKDCGPLLGIRSTEEVTMRMLKSAYGLADAPLLWFREATRRLKKLDLIPQRLDQCTFGFYGRKSKRLSGMLILHVDDMLLAGNMKSDFGAVVEELKKNFDFGKWEVLDKDHPITYCGGQLLQQGETVVLSFESYIKKVVPLTIPKHREIKKELSSLELTRCRGLLGALQWPGGQGFPSLMASTSIIAGEIPGGTGEVMQSLNKALRFAKENAKHGLQFHSVAKKVEDVALLCFCDAAFGVRRDLSSQGGFIIVMTDKRVLHGEKCPFTPLAWKSFKLPRVCRSSLGAESQAMAGALEELLMVKTFFRMLLDQDVTLSKSQETLTMPCAVVTDCRALFDLLKKENIQTSNDKRVAIESLVIRDLLKQVNGELRWVSSERQLADPMTKISTRQQMIEAMKSGFIQLIHDENFVAAKKKTAADREKSRVQTTSRIAMTTCALVASECLKGSEAANVEQEDIPWFLIFFTVAVALMFHLVVRAVGAFVYRSKTTSDASTQTEVMDVKDQGTWIAEGSIYSLERELNTKEYELGEMFERVRELERDNEDLQEREVRPDNQLGQMTLCALRRYNAPNHVRFADRGEIWFTRQGQCWHSDPHCHTISRSTAIRSIVACRECTAHMAP